MKLEDAINHRESFIALLSSEKLPVDDLPGMLENCYVAIENQTVIGTIGLEIYGEYGLLRSLATDKTFRNRGIAGELIHQIETIAREKHLIAIYLLTETALDFFEHKNYKIVARTDIPEPVQQSTEFSHVCPQSAIAMAKQLETKQ